jgi:hypothetical protein
VAQVKGAKASRCSDVAVMVGRQWLMRGVGNDSGAALSSLSSLSLFWV